MFQRPEVTLTSKKEISQALNQIKNLLKISQNTKLPSLKDYIELPQPTQYNKPKTKIKQPMPTINITDNEAINIIVNCEVCGLNTFNGFT